MLTIPHTTIPPYESPALANPFACVHTHAQQGLGGQLACALVAFPSDLLLMRAFEASMPAGGAAGGTRSRGQEGPQQGRPAAGDEPPRRRPGPQGAVAAAVCCAAVRLVAMVSLEAVARCGFAAGLTGVA
jgi:hypothetical protein